jgi:hypothetical protein
MSPIIKSRLMPRILRFLLLVLLLGLTPLFFLWNQNVNQIQSIVVLQPLLITILFILVISGLWLLVSRSLEKAAILACLTFMFFFSFGHLYDLIEGKTLFGISIGYVKLFIVYMVVFTLLIVVVLRSRNIPKVLFEYLYIVTVILLMVNIIPILVHEIKLIKPNSQQQETPNLTQNAVTNQRDIYYIVLDAYARQDILKSLLNYDNSAFLAALKDRGFYIPSCGFSNYDSTDLTIASVLNYDFLQDLKVSGRTVGQDLVENPNRIIDNKVRTYFKQYGYIFVTGRGYTPANDISNSDIYLNYFIDNKGKDDLSQKRFSALYLNTTALRALSELYNQNPSKYSQLPFWLSFDLETNPSLEEATFWYYQNNYVFDSLEKIPSKPGSYLVYAHLNAPHGPYVYQSDGSFQYPLGNPLDPQVEKVLYAHEITYLNKRVLQVVDTLLKDSNPQPIIIIQGDHGIHTLTTGLDIHKNLSAYYLPGNLIAPPYPTITPVNNFRLIIKNYFDPSIELSPDILYIKYLNEYESVPASCDPQP